jgi:hypothetical protein
MRGASRNNPPTPSERKDAERFVEQLDQMFIQRLIEAGAFSAEEWEPSPELYEELDWLLRKIGFVEPGARRRRSGRARRGTRLEP